MKKICVITGGGSGIGFAAAKVMGKDHDIIISGRTLEKLEEAVNELRSMGMEAQAFQCDVSVRESVEALAKHASEAGIIKSVIHAAGISPAIQDIRMILNVNAVGTIYVNETFFSYMSDSSCLIDIASMAGYMLPNKILPVKKYTLSRADPELFTNKMLKRVNLFPKKYRSGVAYGLSKNFVSWYAKTDAEKFSEKGIRVLSVSPGFIETPMGETVKEESRQLIEKSAVKRFGTPEEIAYLIRSLTDERLTYLTGTDILCDGGCIASTLNR